MASRLAEGRLAYSLPRSLARSLRCHPPLPGPRYSARSRRGSFGALGCDGVRPSRSTMAPSDTHSPRMLACVVERRLQRVDRALLATWRAGRLSSAPAPTCPRGASCADRGLRRIVQTRAQHAAGRNLRRAHNHTFSCSKACACHFWAPGKFGLGNTCYHFTDVVSSPCVCAGDLRDWPLATVSR